MTVVDGSASGRQLQGGLTIQLCMGVCMWGGGGEIEHVGCCYTWHNYYTQVENTIHIKSLTIFEGAYLGVFSQLKPACTV